MSSPANPTLQDLVNEQAVRLMMPGSDVEPGEWLGFLNTLRQLAATAGRADVSRVIDECVVETGRKDTEPSITELQGQLIKLQQACEGRPAAPSASLSDDAELVRDFILESRDHLQTIERLMLSLEHDPSDVESIHATFRGFHTIKGLAGFLEFATIQEVAHEVETLLDQARNGEISITGRIVDLILASADHLGQHLAVLEDRLQGVADIGVPPDATDLLTALRALLSGEAGKDPEQTAEIVPGIESSNASTIVIAAAPPPPVELPAGPVKIATPEPAALVLAEAAPAARRPDAKNAISAVKVDTAKLDYLVDMVGELVISQSLVQHHPDLKALSNSSLLRNLAQLARITDEVQKTAMSMRMVPLEMLFQKMVRLVRDLSRKAGKQIEMEISGEDTELDRNIVEALADPLMHMVRNSVDHGIETTVQRSASGKAPAAKVRLHAAHQAGYILIAVSDDGRGIDRRKVLKKARDRGLIEGTGEGMPDSEVFNLIFEPGFSTAEQITDISGRGVGMDVVKRQIQKLRGRIEIQSSPGQGTEISLKVPLTLAIIEGLIVGVGSERYIVPIFAVKEMLRPTAGMISSVENRAEVALVRGRVLPVIRLHRRFQVTPRTEDAEQSLLIIAEARGRDFCLMVDDLIGKQEVVIKSLGEGVRAVPGIAGGAILGDGRVGLILDMNGVFSPEPAEQMGYEVGTRAA
jgi:two-component system chemotaxis sensor kinase CheA